MESAHNETIHSIPASDVHMTHPGKTISAGYSSALQECHEYYINVLGESTDSLDCVRLENLFVWQCSVLSKYLAYNMYHWILWRWAALDVGQTYCIRRHTMRKRFLTSSFAGNFSSQITFCRVLPCRYNYTSQRGCS